MHTPRQKIAIKVVVNLHRIAGRILDVADFIEGRIVIK